MKRLLTVAILAGACRSQPHLPATAPADRCAAGALPEGPVVVDVEVGGRTRRALAWFPPTAGPKDVVVNLHEFRSMPQRQVAYSGWLRFVPEANVILVAPDGRSATWNAGDCCGRAMEAGEDDVAFLDGLIARLDAVACTSGRVLATGIGNGAMMAERWACASAVPDAVVSVGGSLQADGCEGPPIPVLHYHGSDDRFVPADGSPGVLEGRRPGHRPVSYALDAWRARNRATDEPRTETDGALTCLTWEGEAPVTSCTVAGGADTWPGAADGAVASASPLADATRGAWAWVRRAWSQPADVADEGGTAPPP